MLVSINWIKEFVDLSGISYEDMVKRFNLSTAEIESVNYKGQNLSGVVVAKIMEVNNHPDSKKLHILKVDDGNKELTQVVCGAPNVRVGLVTAFARIGANVNGTKINKAKLAGVDSYGMCCSETELGIGSDDSGIVELDSDLTPGKDIKTIFPIDDVIFEVDNKSLTNRPDLWGHYGMAREFATIFKRKLKPLKLYTLASDTNLPSIDIKVSSPDCYRYSAITVKNIVKHVSPIKMKIRLNYCGMRDINLLADITNYVMLELGQPMHAFDNKIVKGINVITTTKPLKMTTLENEQHEIPVGSVVICDNKKEPVAIAGIKGGLKSGITDSTTSLLLESATFSPVAVRKTSKKIGLVTDASQRYEKSLDPELTVTAIKRLLELLSKICPDMVVTSKLSDVYNYKYPKNVITMDADFINKRGGTRIAQKEIVDILTRLGFGVTVKDKTLKVKVPSYRGTKDVSIKEDLVEEVLRIYGYDNIKPAAIKYPLAPVVQDRAHTLNYDTKYLLASKYGLSEVHTYIWNYQDFNKAYGIQHPSYVELLDSSNSGQAGIRSMLLPSLIKAFVENKNNFNSVRIMEIGRVATGLNADNLAIEENHLAFILADTNQNEETLYFEAKSIIEDVANNLVGTTLQFKDSSTLNYMHPVNSTLIYSQGVMLGHMGIMHPSTKNKIDNKYNIVMLEIDFNKLANLPKQAPKRQPVTKFQSNNIDINFVADKDMPYSEIASAIDEFKCNHIVTYTLIDVYENYATLKGKKSYTFRFNLTPKTKTLESKDIEIYIKRMVSHMAARNILLRQ